MNINLVSLSVEWRSHLNSVAASSFHTNILNTVAFNQVNMVLLGLV